MTCAKWGGESMKLTDASAYCLHLQADAGGRCTIQRTEGSYRAAHGCMTPGVKPRGFAECPGTENELLDSCNIIASSSGNHSSTVERGKVRKLDLAKRNSALKSKRNQLNSTTCFPCSATPSMRSSFTRRMDLKLAVSGGGPCSPAADVQCCLTCFASCLSGSCCLSACGSEQKQRQQWLCQFRVARGSRFCPMHTAHVLAISGDST